MVGGGCPQAPYLMTPPRSRAPSKPRTTTSAARASPTTTPTPSTTAAPTVRPKASTSRARRMPVSASTSAGRCPASGSSTRWTSPPAPTTSRCGWPRRPPAARSTSSSTGSTRPAPSAFPATGGWQSWTTVEVEDVTFDGGVQTLRLAIDAGEFNVNKITHRRAGGAAAGRRPRLRRHGARQSVRQRLVRLRRLGRRRRHRPQRSDLPPVDGGVFSLETGWGSGGVPGFFGGFGRTNPLDLTGMPRTSTSGSTPTPARTTRWRSTCRTTTTATTPSLRRTTTSSSSTAS